MTRAIVLVVVAACEQAASPPAPTPEPVRPADAAPPVVPVALDAAPPLTPPGRDQLALDVTVETCNQATVDACHLAALAGTTVAGTASTGDCRVELRHRKLFAFDDCTVVVQRGARVLVIDADLQCKRYDDASARIALGKVACGADPVVELGDAQTHLQVGCHGTTCTRDRVELPVDAALRTLLDRVRRSVEKHAWSAVLADCAPDHRQSQMHDLGQTAPQYLREVLGMNDANATPIALADLDKITRVEIVEVAARATAGNFSAIGWAHLTTGAKFRVILDITKIGNRYYLSGAVG